MENLIYNNNWSTWAGIVSRAVMSIKRSISLFLIKTDVTYRRKIHNAQKQSHNYY